METLKKCEICGSDDFKFLFNQKDKNFGVPGEFSLWKCQNCGIIFLNPQPTPKELKKYYPKKSYYSFEKIVTAENGREKFKIFLQNLYFGRKKGNVFLRMIFLPLLPHIRGTKIIPQGKILDVGCGSGQFLYEMKEFGMKPFGIDPGEIDKEYAKDLNIKKDLMKAKYESNFFDLITMHHVLQHVHNPLGMLRELKRILKKRGVFIICVSNYGSLAQKIFKKDWYQFDIPRHLFNFSDKILINILKKEGFKIEKIRYNSWPQQFVTSFYYKKNWSRTGKIYKLLNLFMWPTAIVANIFKKGDQIEIWCTK